MKKLMLTAAVLSLAAITQAASVSWANAEYTCYAGSTTAAQGETMYLIRTTDHAQSELLTTILAYFTAADVQTIVNTWAVTTTTGDAYGAFEQNGVSTLAFTSGASETAYVVLFDTENNNVFMSSVVTADYDGMGGTSYDFNFDAMASASMNEAITGWDSSSTAAGWYSVPEPTSGMLLLLGFCGLALRRKQKKA